MEVWHHTQQLKHGSRYGRMKVDKNDSILEKLHASEVCPEAQATYIIHTVWRLYFAGLNFRELLFENISLKKFREFAVKCHAHTMGVVYSAHRT